MGRTKSEKFRTISNQKRRSTEDDWTNLMFVYLNVN